MLTTGSKLFLGATVLSIVSAFVVAVCLQGSAAWVGVIALISAAVSFAFLFGINYYLRDCNVSAMSENATTESPAAQPPVQRSMWPAIAAVAVGAIAVGAVSKPIVFKAGVLLLLAAGGRVDGSELE